MTLQYTADPQMDSLIKMTSDVIMKIKQKTKEMYL